MNMLVKIGVVVDIVADIAALWTGSEGEMVAISLLAGLVPSFIGAWRLLLADDAEWDELARGSVS